MCLIELDVAPSSVSWKPNNIHISVLVRRRYSIYKNDTELERSRYIMWQRCLYLMSHG
jgi:hypothetical protein